MTDQNPPQDPGQPNQPSQPPSAGSPYGPPPDQPGSGQPGYVQPGQHGSPPQPGQGFGQPPVSQPGYQAPATPGGYPAPGAEGGFQAPGTQGGYPAQGPGGYPPPGAQGGYQAPGTPGAFAPAGMGAPGSGQFGPPHNSGQPAGWAANPNPPQPGPPSKSGSKMPLIIGGSVVVAIALIFGMMQLFNRPTTGTTGTPGGGSSTSASTGTAVGAGSATEAVQKYFDALAASDPDAVFNLVRGDLPDRTFLTREVMTAAATAAPITNLQLSELTSSNYSAEIEAQYTINARTMTQKFFTSTRDGRWYLSNVAARLYVKSLNPVETGLTLNGVQVGDKEAVEVFPGGYTLGTTSDTYTLSEDKVVVESLSSTTDIYEIRTVLTDSALTDFRAATKKLVDSCEKPGSMKNADCGMNWRQPSNGKIKPSSITCASSGTSSIAKMKPTLDSTDLSARGSLSVTFKCKMQATNGNRYTGTDFLFAVYGTKSDSGWKVSAERP